LSVKPAPHFASTVDQIDSVGESLSNSRWAELCRERPRFPGIREWNCVYTKERTKYWREMMKVTDLSGELTINAEATGSLEGSYTTSMSISGTEGSSGGSSFTAPFGGSGLSGLGESIREQVRSNLAGALAGLPTLPGIGES
jgi:hypothetical protein